VDPTLEVKVVQMKSEINSTFVARYVMWTTNTLDSNLLSVVPRMGPGYPLSAFAPPLSIYFVIFCSLLLFPFSFSHSRYLFFSIVHPIHFYQNRPTPFPGERS